MNWAAAMIASKTDVSGRVGVNGTLHFDVAYRFRIGALDDIVAFLIAAATPNQAVRKSWRARAHIADHDQPVAAIDFGRLTIGGAIHTGVKAVGVVLRVTLLRVLDHGVNAGVPRPGRLAKPCRSQPASFWISLSTLLLVARIAFDQILLVEVKDALGIFGLLLDLQGQVGGVFGLFPQAFVGAAKGGVIGARRGEAYIEAKDVAPVAHFGRGLACIEHG